MIAFDAAQLVGAGGALGALCRHAVSTRLPAEDYPLGTLAVNVLGSFTLGLLTFSGVGGDALLFLGTGACGAFTTFSSFAYETMRFVEADDYARAIIYGGGTFLAASAAVLLAWVVTRAL
ncbi:fluoride efflux transporter CrcB [Halocalculus aciditolerans]|uniref:Fluoride-specific ion channel FluC n=1 Tax=Halocalculus aciditolerans TaxID=1383812 RepID=A0A830F6F9_9EURY|nr:fluoride efflux transporter CrcB [Halocalculus aciditolerans]GGL68008.1 chromosome condensation protein CrcB [Halocalculus aciditolerans]